MTTDVLGAATGANTPNPNDAKDLLVTLVGEGKTFKDNEALAKGKIEADKFIEQLKSEKAEVLKALKEAEEKAAQGTTLKDLMERIEKASPQNGNQPGTLSKEDIEKLVQSTLTTHDTKRERAGNRALTNAELLNKFGGDATKAAEFVKQKTAQLGITPAILNEIAETSPASFRELFGLSKPANQNAGGSALPAGRNTPDLTNGGGEERGKSYYSKMRKDLGWKYFEPAIQQQMFKDRERLGERFNQL